MNRIDIDMEESNVHLDLVKSINNCDLVMASAYFNNITEVSTANQRIALCNYLFYNVDKNNYTVLLLLICKFFSVNNIRKILEALSEDKIYSIKNNIDFKYLVWMLINENLDNKLSIIIETFDCEDDVFSLIPEDKIDILLLHMNTEMYIEQYIYRNVGCCNDDELLDFLASEPNISGKYKFKKYKKIMINNLSLRKKTEKLILDLLENSDDIIISMKTIISFAIGLGEENFFFVKQLINSYSSQKYNVNKCINGAGENNEGMYIIYNLVNAKYSLQNIIYLFMNTKLRSQVTLDRLVDKLIDLGYYEENIINEINNYWISGEIKYIEDGGNIRVCPMSVFSSRLMTFNLNYQKSNDVYHIGDVIYYKIYCFFQDGKKFIIDCICKNVKE